jgi:hypothetical protein
MGLILLSTTVAVPASAGSRYTITADVYVEAQSIRGWYQPDDLALNHMFEGSRLPAELKSALIADKRTRKLLSYALASRRSANNSRVTLDIKGGPPWVITLVLISETTVETSSDFDRTRRMTSRTPIATITAVSASAGKKATSGRDRTTPPPVILTEPVLPGRDYGMCAEGDKTCSARIQTRLLTQPHTAIEKLLIERDVKRALAIGYRINDGQITRDDLEQTKMAYKQRLEKVVGSEFPSGALDDLTQENFGTNVSRMQPKGPSLPDKPDSECAAQFTDTSNDVIPTIECARANFNYKKWVKHDFLAAWSRIPLINPQNLPYIGVLAAAYVANVADLAAGDKVYQGVWALMWMDRVASWNATGNTAFVTAAVAQVHQSRDEQRILLDWLAEDSGTLADFSATRDLLYDEYLTDLLPDAEWPDSSLPKLSSMPEKVTWVTNLIAKARRTGYTDKKAVELALAAPDGPTARETMITLLPWLENHPRYSGFGKAVGLGLKSDPSLRP